MYSIWYVNINVRLGGWSGVCKYRLGLIGSQFHPIGIKFDPDWVKFWPHWIPLAPLGPEVEFGHFGVKIVKTWSSRRWYFIVKIRRWAPFGKNTKKSLPNHMCFSDESWFCDALACTGARRPWPTPQPAHRTKGSSDLASSEVTRIVAFWPFWEFVNGATGAAGESEMASRTAARSPPPTRAGGQDDGSYTNSLKLFFREIPMIPISIYSLLFPNWGLPIIMMKRLWHHI